MGNTISKEPESKSLDWNSLNSDLQINQKYLSSDSKLLIEKLTLNLHPVSEESPDNIDAIFSKFTKGSNSLVVGNQVGGLRNEQVGGNNSEDLSDTSPFISSEMYNILMKDNKPQIGGGEIEGDDSSTSATSSSSDNKKKKANKRNYKGKTDSNETTPNEETTAQEKAVHANEEESVEESVNKSEISYESSSAHDETETKEEESETKEEESETKEEETKETETKEEEPKKKGKKAKKQEENTTQNGGESSIINENSNLPPSSIRTSDINMISESS